SRRPALRVKHEARQASWNRPWRARRSGDSLSYPSKLQIPEPAKSHQAPSQEATASARSSRFLHNENPVRGLAFTKKARAHVVVHGQIGTTKKMVWNSTGFLGDQRHRSGTKRGSLWGRILKERAKPTLNGVASGKIAAMFFRVTISRGLPVGSAGELVPQHAGVA